MGEIEIELAYELGEAFSARVRDAASNRVEEIVDELCAMGALVSDGKRGFGWHLFVGGVDQLEERGLVFAHKGAAWIFWVGMGRPSGSAVVAVVDPVVEWEACVSGSFSLHDFKLDSEPPRLRLVQQDF